MPDIVEIIPIREIAWAVTAWQAASLAIILSIYLGVHLGRRVLAWLLTGGFVSSYQKFRTLKQAGRIVYDEIQKRRGK